MASLIPNLNPGKQLGRVFMMMSIVLGTSPSLAQLPQSSPHRLSEAEAPTYIRPETACPEDFDTLSALLIRDLPSYTNRILQSSVADIPQAYRPAYVIAASLPESAPLDITEQVYTTRAEVGEPLRQLFFTTLERQYSGLDATEVNHFHWLFLAPGEESWQMVFMFSVIEAEGEVQSPPRDSSQGSVGQAVQRWLRDCRTEAIFPE